MPLSTTHLPQHVDLFFCLLPFILMGFCVIDCLGEGIFGLFYFGFGLFYKVIGLIFTQVKAHKFSLGEPINSWCNSELFK